MKLRGLPADVHPGPVELRFADAAVPLLQACSLCKNYNKFYLMCRHFHVTCQECFLPDLPSIKMNRPRYEGFCRSCSTRVTMYCIEIPLTLLKGVRFKCGCDFVGRLADIKRHVKSDSFRLRCSQIEKEPVTTSDEFDVKLATLQSEIEEIHDDYTSQLFAIQEKLKRNFSDQIEQADGKEIMMCTQPDSDSTILNLGLLDQRLKGLIEECMTLKEESANTTPVIQDNFGRILERLKKRTIEAPQVDANGDE